MIVVTTPTGRIGRQVLERVVDAGRPVRVIARDPDRLAPEVRERVEVVRGSHAEPAVVAEAFAGADSALWLVPPDRTAGSVEAHYLGFTRPACEVLRRQGGPRVVGISSLGRAYAGNAGMLTPAFAMDGLIEDTGVGYRALRMPFFMENLLNQVGAIKGPGTFFLANDADRPLATVSARDVAATAAALLLDASWSGQDSVPVVGPDALSPVDLARVMSEVLERPIRFQQVDGPAYQATLTERGMTEAWARGLVDMAAAQNDGVYDAEWRALRTAAPTGFRQWCAEVLRPAVLA